MFSKETYTSRRNLLNFIPELVDMWKNEKKIAVFINYNAPEVYGF